MAVRGVVYRIGVGRAGKTLHEAFVVTAACGVHADRLRSGLASPVIHHGVVGEVARRCRTADAWCC